MNIYTCERCEAAIDSDVELPDPVFCRDCRPTVRVRIAVAVTPDGDFYAVGWGHSKRPDGQEEDFEQMKEQAIENAAVSFEKDREAIVWVTADVPLPQEAEVRGEAEE